MQLDLSPLSIDRFLAEYWQQKPALIKGGLKHFRNPVEPDELAGLATEPDIESRLMYQKNTQWFAESGPFDDFQAYGDSHWSLVVQSVNHWLPAVQDFARLFDFIPQWRFDDVMVSFAAPQGGVGPHVDNYDVFICQGSGQRRWRVGDYGDYDEFVAHEKLRHVKPFTPIIDVTTCAGDVLYIPPGFPHEGVSLDRSMSFSVGYKSTQATELLSAFADYLIDKADSPQLLSDKARQRSGYGEINAQDKRLLHQLLRQTLDDDEKLSDFIGTYCSQSRSELDLVNGELAFDAWLAQFKSQPLHKLYALKTLYVADTLEHGVFYVDGEKQQLDVAAQPIRQLCDQSRLDYQQVKPYDNLLHWLWQATQQGYWYFE